MTIMIVHHFGQIGGGTNSCFDVCKMLRESGHDVVTVIPAPSLAVKQLAQDIGVRLISATKNAVCLHCHNADSGTTKAAIKCLLSLKNIAYWKKLFKNEKPDLIMFNSSVLGPLVHLAKRLGFKTVCFIRETSRESGPNFWRKIHSWLLSKADGIAYLTQFDVSDWAIPGNAYHIVIPDVVDTARFRTSNISHRDKTEKSDEKYLLYLGGFSEEKGALDLLQAFEICVQKNPHLHLLILGNTCGVSDINGIKKLFRSKKVKYHMACREKMYAINKKTDRVHEIGLVSDVALWYEMADVVIFPVKKVHQARPVYEAGFFRKPIIISDFANFCDSVIDGYNGVVYKKYDIEDMSEKILSTFANEELLESMGNNNFEVYSKEHTYFKVKERVEKFVRGFMLGGGIT